MPFKDEGAEKTSKHIIDGLCDEIINNLSVIDGFKVVSRTSAMKYHESGKIIKKICSENDIPYAIEGRIKKTGSALQIEANLKDVFKEKILNTFNFSGTLNEIFQFQENVSRAIAETFKVKLSTSGEKKTNNYKADNFSVLEYYLKARQEIFQGQKSGLESAIELLKGGLSKFGDKELLYAGLGTAYWQYLNLGYSNDYDYLHQIQNCADKIFQMNPNSPLGSQLIGVINYKYGKVDQAARMFKTSFSANKNDPVTLYFLSTIYGNLERMKPAKLLAKRLAEIDPVIAMSQLLPAIIYYFEGRFQKAYEIGKKAVAQHPEDPIIIFYFGVFSAANKRNTESFELFEVNFQKNPENLYANLGLLFKYALNGTSQMVMQGISDYLSDVAIGDEELSIWMADIYSLIGEKELALKWIQNAAKKGFINYSFFKKYDPFLKNIRKDSNFKEILEDIKLMNKAFKE